MDGKLSCELRFKLPVVVASYARDGKCLVDTMMEDWQPRGPRVR